MVLERFIHNGLFLRVQVLSIPLAQRIRQDGIGREAIGILSIMHKCFHGLLMIEEFLQIQ